MISGATMVSYDSRYLRALNPSSGDLKLNLLAELRDYLGLDLTDEDLYVRCRQGTQAILEDWRRKNINPADATSVTQFYIETQLYCYELLALEIDAPAQRQEQLFSLAALLKDAAKLRGCDYGSGIGTLGLYLNKSGIVCDFADVSETNLNFIQARLKRRNLVGPRLINLTKDKIPGAAYDFVTAFDVLEHVAVPLDPIQDIAAQLRPGGYFIFNVLCEDELNTPHLLRDPDLIRKNIRGYGLTKVGSLGEFKIYKKVTRPRFTNGLLRRVDGLFWDARKKLQTIAKRDR